MSEHQHQCEHRCGCLVPGAIRCVDCELQHVYAERHGAAHAAERHVMAVPLPLAVTVAMVANSLLDYETTP